MRVLYDVVIQGSLSFIDIILPQISGIRPARHREMPDELVDEFPLVVQGIHAGGNIDHACTIAHPAPCYYSPMPATTLEALKEKLQLWKGIEIAKNANPVFGEGNPKAEVMFIGEAPGEQEDKQGRPFVGPAGKFLDELLGTIGLKRTDVYISNVVKFRPPDNREPLPEEKEACLPWLKAEIALIKPKVLAPLGRHALTQFFPKLNISAAHGKPHKLTDTVHVFPIYHPAAALHNPNLRQALYDDFAALGAFLKTHTHNG